MNELFPLYTLSHGGIQDEHKTCYKQDANRAWAEIIKDCKEIGLKVDDYCAQHAFPDAYFYWLLKVKEAALTPSGFVEVRQQVEVSHQIPGQLSLDLI